MKYRRLVSLALVLAFAAACLPLARVAAFAEESAGETRAFLVNDDGLETEQSVGEVPEDFEFVVDDDGVALPEDAEVLEANPAAASNAAPERPKEGGADLSALLDDLGGAVSNAAPNAVQHSVTITQSGSTVTIKGSVPSQYVLGGVIVDETFLTTNIFGSSVDYSFNINNGSFATGYHTVVVGIYQKNADGGAGDYVEYIMQKYIEANVITDKPTYVGRYEVYSNYFNIYPFQMSAFGFAAPRLYLEYSSDNGKTWKRSGYMKPGGVKLAIEEGYKISGLQPNTTYKTRLRYGEAVTYSTRYDGDGESYIFLGPALNSTTIKTGKAAKPSVKSVTVKATNVKYHKTPVPGHYEWAGTSLIWIGSFTEKYYTCKVKVTVNLKKKPGAKGLWIAVNDGFGVTEKFVKGDKKTYTFSFTPHVNYFSKKPNKCNLKYTVTVRSGQSSKWGGYSPSWSKAQKLS